ncbi:DUF2567 domain-containing protein [Streptomyces flavofungini]|uniref:DUF2567 domain-containing protein n=1 Tax=Streptomyces flavofungini TaxID=68200 RepID=A0ABS0X2S4_9ACTN|nr:DUF2567 domain-containing protein [Streptomyces flavofungini]MBJ3807494.1 DUF2567 domain-containing protein [Streptomyces flavofungini]
MTAPLTPSQPPHDQPEDGTAGPDGSDDPWREPARPSGPAPETAYEEGGAPVTTDLKADVRDAVVIMVAVAASGVLLGLLWLWLAPTVPLIADKTTVYLKDTEGEQAIGVDGTFALLGLAFGLLSAVVVFLVRRRGGIPLVVGLAAGGLLGAVLAWKVGVWVGPETDVAAHARSVGAGVVFDAPMELKAKGVLLAWPVAAMVFQLVLTGLFGPRDPEPFASYGSPYRDGYGAPER